MVIKKTSPRQCIRILISMISTALWFFYLYKAAQKYGRSQKAWTKEEKAQKHHKLPSFSACTIATEKPSVRLVIEATHVMTVKDNSGKER